MKRYEPFNTRRHTDLVDRVLTIICAVVILAACVLTDTPPATAHQVEAHQ